MHCHVLVGSPGCGKSTKVHNDIISEPARWLLALPRTDLIEEHALDLQRKALSNGQSLPVEAIHSDQPKMKGTVQNRVVQALDRFGQFEHAAVLISHEALLSLDPNHLHGWRIAIDEPPDSAVQSGTFAAGTSWSTLAILYDLHPVQPTTSGEPPRWWRVVVRADAERPTPGEVLHDDATTLRAFHACALGAGRAVFVDIGDWQDARSNKRKIKWHSCWTPEALLRHAASVTFAGAGVTRSLMYHAAQHAPSGPIAFLPVQAGAARTGRPRVLIHYYTRHEGSTVWWETDEGSRCLVAISRHLEAIGFDGYWSGNDVVRPYFRHRFGGQEVSPKLAGTNQLRHHRRCALFYSNKAQAADEPIMQALGLDREDIRRAREDEDIAQFVFRGLLRDGSFGGLYEAHLYSLRQAEMLKGYLVENGITDDVDLVPVWEAGAMEVERPGPKDRRAEAEPVTRTQREERRAEQARLRSRKNREAKIAKAEQEGTRRKRGRPTKRGEDVDALTIPVGEGLFSTDIHGVVVLDLRPEPVSVQRIAVENIPRSVACFVPEARSPI